MKRAFTLAAAVILLCQAPFFLGCQKRKDRTYRLKRIAQSDELWTGVAVSQEGRIFVNFPRWTGAEKISVAEILGPKERRPFPDETWNKWDTSLSPGEHLVCVQSVYIDAENNLWILDSGNPLLKGVVEGGAKLIKVNLRSDKVVQTVRFDATITPPLSYLNDVRVDTRRQHAYITDSGEGAIVVVDLAAGRARRVLYDHPSTKAEDTTFIVEGITLGERINCDGLTLDSSREYLYYQALTGRRLYRIRTQLLRDFSLSEQQLGEKVELVAQTVIADGIEFGKDGNLYLTSLEHNAIRRLTPDGKIEVAVQDQALKWPDSLSITARGDIYVTTSQLHLGPAPAEPYRIFQLQPEN